MSMIPSIPVSRRVTDNSGPEIQATPIPEKRGPGRPKGSKSQHNVKRDEERAIAREQRERKVALWREQEEKRAPRLMPDTKFSLFAFLALALIAIGTSFTVSYTTLAAVAEWMRLPIPELTYIVPGFIEVIIVLSGVDYIIVRSRGGKGFVPLAAMFLLTGVAVVGNVAHTVGEWLADGETIPWQGLIGAGLAALAALAVVYITKRLTVITFAEPIEL